MTLTPAIREALDNLRSEVTDRVVAQERYETVYTTNEDIAKAEANLLSVVAAEEGRKYEALAKLVKEWQAAGREFDGVSPGDPRWMEVSQRWDNACDALAQWEAL